MVQSNYAGAKKASLQLGFLFNAVNSHVIKMDPGNVTLIHLWRLINLTKKWTLLVQSQSKNISKRKLEYLAN